jgi:hypothetical protein
MHDDDDSATPKPPSPRPPPGAKITYIKDDPPRDVDWNGEVKAILKAELKRRSLTYADLVERLAYFGIQETEPNLRNKISRGSFTAAFMLQCLWAMRCHALVVGWPYPE